MPTPQEFYDELADVALKYEGHLSDMELLLTVAYLVGTLLATCQTPHNATVASILGEVHQSIYNGNKSTHDLIREMSR